MKPAPLLLALALAGCAGAHDPTEPTYSSATPARTPTATPVPTLAPCQAAYLGDEGACYIPTPTPATKGNRP